MQRKSVCRRLTLISCIALLPISASGQVTFTALGQFTGGSFQESIGSAMTPDGKVVVGYSQSASGRQAFRWTAATGLVGIGSLNSSSVNSRARGVSADGNTIVGGSTDSSGQFKPFRWTASGGMTNLGTLSGQNGGFANGISADGNVIVGESSIASTNAVSAFRWTASGGMTNLGLLPGGISTASTVANAASPDGSVIVGGGTSGFQGQDRQAFRWTAATGMVGLGDLPGSLVESEARGLSSDGNFIIGQGRSASGREAFLWTASGGMIGLGDLPGGSFTSNALAVSLNGTVVGESETAFAGSGSASAAFIWRQGFGMLNLQDYANSLQTNAIPTGWTIRQATAISEDGTTILGNAINPSGRFESFILSLPGVAVPEPGALSLLAFGGLASLGVLRRRTKR